MADLLPAIEEFLRDERARFGETVLAEQAAPPLRTRPPHTPPSEEPPMKRPASPPEEPLLFDLPSPKDAPLTTEAWGATQSLEDLNGAICTCLKCPLGQTRTKFVFGVGNPRATLMLVGEAPGADEDAQGEPFVGRAGQLLNKILEAIRFRRGDVYICNILKCRPPGNRKPQADEVAQCLPYLKKQIELIRPRLIVCLGLTAAENLLGTTETLTALRGRVMRFQGTPVMVTYHPAALLRNPNWKRPAWEDVQAVRRLHDELAGEGG